jgi:hypothetical protein
MSTSSQAIQKAVQRLRGQMVRTARGFRDYNFRQYFVQHVKDDFDAVSKLPLEEQKQFLVKEGRNKLRQMQRMVVVNQMYAKRPVYFDTAEHQHPHHHNSNQQPSASAMERRIE